MQDNTLAARRKRAFRPRITLAGKTVAPNLIKGLEVSVPERNLLPINPTSKSPRKNKHSRVRFFGEVQPSPPGTGLQYFPVRIKRLFAILAIALIPALSQARIGETKVDLEARWGKPTRTMTMKAFLSLLGEANVYRDEQGNDVYVWFRFGKVIGEAHPADNDDDVTRIVRDSLGTVDLEERAERVDISPVLKAAGLESYITKDGEFAAVIDLRGKSVYVGTKSFIESYERAVVDEVNSMLNQQQQQQLSPAAAKFDETLMTAVKPVHEILLTIMEKKTLKAANDAIPILEIAQRLLAGMEDLWKQIPHREKFELWNEIVGHQDSFIRWHEYLYQNIKGLEKNHGFLLELDHIIDGLTHLFDTENFNNE